MAVICLGVPGATSAGEATVDIGIPAVCSANGNNLAATKNGDEVLEGDLKDANGEEPAGEMQPSAGAMETALEERRPLVYLTREDRREAGIKHAIFPWLTLAGLLESEWSSERLRPVEDGRRTRDRELANSVQIAAEVTPSEWSKLELIYEYEDDDDHNRHILDEAVLSVEHGDFEWEAGRLYAPFGEYFSHFIEGPVLEFAETRATGMNLSYSPSEALDLKAYAYDGKASEASGGEVDWGIALEVSPFEMGTLGLSYISDLGDAEDPVADPEDLEGSGRVDGLSGYAVFGFGDFEFNAEFVAALNAFDALDPEADRPFAWNAEIAYYPSDRYEIAFRIEGSREIADAPQSRAGLGAAVWLWGRAALRIEYLRGTFRPGLAKDDLEQELDSIELIASQLNIEF